MLKKYIIILAVTVSISFPANIYAQNWGEKDGCCLIAILIPAFIVQSIIDGFDELGDNIDDSRTVSVKVNGVKAEFQRNTVDYNEKRKDSILKGKLLKEIKISVRGKTTTILPGEITFYENGNIARCLISSSELYIGDNTTVRCRDLVEFYDDEFLKSTILLEDSEDDMRLFNIQGKERSLTGEISFYRNGQIESCLLKKSADFNLTDYSIHLPEKTAISLNENNKIIYINPHYKTSIMIKYKGKLLQLSEDFSLHENGKLRGCVLSDALNIENGLHKLRVRGRISFYNNEMIQECIITNPTPLRINNSVIEFEKDEKLSFYKNGNLKSGKITSKKKQFYTHNGNRIRVSDGSEIKFYEDGSLSSLCPYDNSVYKVGNDSFILDDSSMTFYKDGGVLSLHCATGTEYYYKGTKLYVNNSSDQLFFNREQELIAFNNDEGTDLIVNGKPVFAPYGVKVSYADYDKKTVDYLMINYSQITLPMNVKIADTEHIEYADIFVKAKDFYNDKNKDKLYARNIQAIMFSEDRVILVDGKEQFCEAMKWIKLSD